MFPLLEFDPDNGLRNANPCCLRIIIMDAGSVFVSESTFPPPRCSSTWNFGSSTAIPRLPGPTRDRRSVIVAWELFLTPGIALEYPRAFKSCRSLLAVPSPPPIAYFLQFIPPASTVSPETFKFLPSNTFFPNKFEARVGSDRVARVVVPGGTEPGGRLREDV
jgi:hypothetical protein